MKFKGKKSFFILLFFMIFTLSFAEYSDAYLEINAKNLKDSFFMTKFDEDNKRIYIGATTLFYFLEIYDVDVDLEDMQVSFSAGGEDFKAKINRDEGFVMDEELYIDIGTYEKKLNFKKISYDYETLSLNVFPNFILPNEERELGKIERLRLDNEKDENSKNTILKMPRKVFTPGFLKLSLNKYGIEKAKSSTLSYEYGNQFLGGSLYLKGKVNNDEEGELIDRGRLTYSGILENKDLVLGSIYLENSNFIKQNGDVIGISLKDDRTLIYRNGVNSVIRGSAENVETIELYRDKFLIDYIHPTEKEFEFKVDEGNLYNDYILKIYYNDGRIEERDVYNVYDINMVEKGKNKVNFQIGKERRTGHSQINSNLYYGLNNFVTVETGYKLITSEFNKEYHLWENGILVNSRHKTFPTLINYRDYYNIDKRGNSYNLSITQKYKTIQLKYINEKYSKNIYEENNLKTYESIALGKPFKSNFIEVGRDKRDSVLGRNIHRKEELNYIYWTNSYFSPFSFSMKFSRNKNQEIFSPTISYYGKFSLILQADFNKYRERGRENYYELRINKRDFPIIKDKLYGDIGGFAQYEEKNSSFVYGLRFSIKLDDLIYLRANTDINQVKGEKPKQTSDIEITKLIDLSNPTRNIKNMADVEDAAIYGKIFYDKNCNEIFDEGDKELQEAIINIDGNRFKSDGKGNYVASGIARNDIITLFVNRKSIDPMMKPQFDALKIRTIASGRLRLDIPIQTISIISGNIWNNTDEDENQFNKKLSMIAIQLIKDNRVVKEIKPEFDGMYFFEDILPGKYRVRFLYLGKGEVKFSKNDLNIDIDTTKTDEGEYLEGLDTELEF